MQIAVRMKAPQQSEFPLRVAICAWCKPKNRGVELGATLGSISRGICPRHVEKLRRELGQSSAGATGLGRATSNRRRGVPRQHPELDYCA